MAKPIQMWKSLDSKVFPSREEADAHDEAVAVIRTSFNLPQGMHDTFYKYLTAILKTKTLVPRVYPTEEK